MKKFLFFLIAAVSLASGAFAKHDCRHKACYYHAEQKVEYPQPYYGGFSEENIPLSVERILTLPTGTRVMVIGHLVNRIGFEEYQFTDGTDDIVAEIDRSRWNGLVVTPHDKVILKGRIVHTDDEDVILKVRSIKKVK